jgi:hypothetical protein
LGCLATIIAAACYQDGATDPALDAVAVLVVGPRSVAVGDTITLFAAVWDKGTRVASPSLTWISSQPALAGVTSGSDSCAVYGMGAGNVTVSAWIDGVADSVVIQVVATGGP